MPRQPRRGRQRRRAATLRAATLRAATLRAATLGAAIALAGCTPQITAGTAVEAPGFRLCDALPVAEILTHHNGPPPRPPTVLNRIDADVYHDAGLASCHYEPDHMTSLRLSVPLGEPVLDLAELIGSPYDPAGQDITVGADKAYLGGDPLERAIAVQHGDVQFVLFWRQFGADEGTDIDAALIELAEAVAGRLPDEVDLPRHDTPAGCPDADTLEALVGPVSMSRGTSTPTVFNCDYLGADGVLNATAVQPPGGVSDNDLDQIRGVHDEILPPLTGDSVVVQVGKPRELDVKGYLADCCSLDVEQTSRRAPDSRDAALSPAERTFTTGFLEATRQWSQPE